jgi:RHS repeat-associated protein
VRPILQRCLRIFLCLAICAGNPLTAKAFASSVGAAQSVRVYLNPHTGRFWTMDTTEGDNEEPLSLHKYLYCQNNPVNMVDPDGLKAYLYLIGEDSSGLPFKKAVDYLSSQLSLTAGDKVVIENIHGFEDFNKALKENTDIVELNYIGHGGPGILFIGEGKDPDTNITEKGGRHVIGNTEFQSKSVKDLYVYNVRRDASIHLYSCYSGRSGWDYSGLNRSFSDHFGVIAYGGWFGTKFKANGEPYTFGGYNGVFVFPSERLKASLSFGSSLSLAF